LTAKLEPVTQPLVIFRFTDREFASRIGKKLAKAIISRALPNITAVGASSNGAVIVEGMHEISSRMDQVIIPPLAVAPSSIPTQTTLSQLQQSSAINSVVQQLEHSWEDDADPELFFGGFGMQLMLRLEGYPRSIALAFQEAFQLEWEEWVQDLVHKEAVISGVEYEDTGLSATGVVDIPSKASIFQEL
jgi:hypothetical protein